MLEFAVPDNFFTYVLNSVLSLFAAHGAFLLGIGRNWFHLVTIVVVFIEGLGLLFNWWDGTHLKRLVAKILVGEAMIFFYAAPMPFVGHSLTGLVTDEARSLSNRLEGGSTEALQKQMNEAYLGLERPGFMNWVAFVYYFCIVLLIAALDLVALAVVGFGIIAAGVCMLLGPLFISFFIWPGGDQLFKSWLMAFIQYNAYQVVASAMIYLVSSVMAMFFTANPGPYSAARIETLFIEFLVIVGIAVYSMSRVPGLVRDIFTGGSGGSFVRV